MKKTRIAGIDFSRKYICMECGCQRDPIDAKRGLLIIELIMWCMFIVPGIIYSIWRRLRKHKVCPNCLNPTVELTNSTRVMQMMRIMKSFAPLPDSVPAASRPPSARPAPGSKAPSKKKDVKQILKTASRRGLKPKGQQGLIDFEPPDKNS